MLPLRLWVFLVMGGAIAWDKIAIAQITPDGTLGAESSSVRAINQLRDQIEGGAIRGANLFHSFAEFNIGAGREVYFANPTGIENILTRVTGSTRSELLGTLGVAGNANLFLINPNGIVFGSNARLDVRGSFLASTASSFQFADGTEFSAANPQAPPLLRINVPMGLQFGTGAGAIATNVNLNPNPVSLNVDSGKTLALLGGDLRLEGGSILQAPEGRIELGSVGDNSFVSFTPTPGGFVLGYEGVQNFGDIQVLGRERAATVSTAGSSGGNIQVQSRKLTLDGIAVIEADTQGAGAGGTVTIRASETIDLNGISPNSDASNRISTVTSGTGNAGNVRIETGRLTIRNGAAVGTTTTQSAGNAGDISINATQSVEMSGNSGIVAGSNGGTGDAGNVTIDTGQLILGDGIIATFSSGAGKAGNVTINATQSVELNGAYRGIAAGSSETGDAGNVTINTGRLMVSNGARVGAFTNRDGNAGNIIVNAGESVELIGTSTDGGSQSSLVVVSSGAGNAGNVRINTGRLIVRDGAGVFAGTFSNGNAGNITIDAPESVELIGTSTNRQNISFLLAGSTSVGNAGNVTIQTGRLIARDGGLISASTIGNGDAGNITIDAAESVELINTSLVAVTTLGNGDAGNIRINTGQLIVRDGTVMSAGTAFGRGNGGTIAINAQQLIVQNGAAVTTGSIASEGNGGTIAINASELVELSGGEQPSSIGAGIENGGKAGDVTIQTGQLIVRDRSRISASSIRVDVRQLTPIQLAQLQQSGLTDLLNRDPGDPGSINITARSLRLDNQSDLNASSETGNGGNITVRSQDIQLRRQSLFSAAGSPTRATKEGSIDINTQSLVLLEASSIITSANDPQGGSNIDIKPRNDLGLAVFQSADSIINARGQLNIEGDIQPSNPNIPQIEVVDATNLIADPCVAARQGSSFVVTGRGGIPASPDQPLGGENVLVDLVTVDTGEHGSRGAGEQGSKIPNTNNEIVEATGWIIDEQGQVVLVAAHTAPGYNPEIKPIDCHVR
jgi:filamentous hemagglutinin family protein